MSESFSFNLLHKDVQRWVWTQNWTALRDIQERSIKPILAGDCDVIISASTAAGKTEAAFLPACSRIANLRPKGIGILYISPLKALINDQYRRLQSLCEMLGFPLTPWHGDVLRSAKDRQKKKPGGIVLITPESLESLLLNQSGWCSQAFLGLSHIIIDEFHAFIGSERGCQLQSLMHRIEFMLNRVVPRIALSATFGDMKLVTSFLRPRSNSFPYEIIESSSIHSDLKIQLRGYLNKAGADEEKQTATEEVIADLYKILRGKSHLIFANSRARVEEFATALADRCEQDGVPNEFFPHHGNLSKEIRENLESRLQEEKFPTSAVCTMTLELGIDIGSVDSIAQVTAPHSVASLRQRLGRSGRRDDAAILRLFIQEEEITATSHFLNRLRLETVQSIAMVNLLLQKWSEPAPANQYHLSTLIQQTLSVIGQYGGVQANQLWALLCEAGPFSLVDQKLYAIVLKSLGEQELLTQTQDGQLVLGRRGEKLVENYAFYTAFRTPEEYRLECEGHVIGTLPIDKPLMVGELIIFAGRRWQVTHVNPEKKVILLKQGAGGKPPKFGGDGQMIHDRVRQEMQRVYLQKIIPVYLDAPAKTNFAEGIEYFYALNLDKKQALQIGNTVYILLWRGDQIVNTVNALLRQAGLAANCYGGLIDIGNCTLEKFYEAVESILQNNAFSAEELATHIPNTMVEKYDFLLPKTIRELSYAKKFFDVNGAIECMKKLNELIVI